MKRHQVIGTAGMLCACVALFSACDRDRDRTSTTRTTGGAPTREEMRNRDYNIENRATTTRFDAEVERLSSARCERETRCNNVGADRRYVTSEHCVASMRNSLRDELNAWDCKGGIDTKELSECMTEIRNEDCGNPLDTVGRLVACRSSDLCVAH